MVSITVRGNDLLYSGYETGAYGDVAGLGFGVNLLVVVVVLEGMDKEIEYFTSGGRRELLWGSITPCPTDKQ